MTLFTVERRAYLMKAEALVGELVAILCVC
jgi:hypothetical protein